MILASSNPFSSLVAIESEVNPPFKSVIDEFDYEINRKELNVDGIFVKHFNSDIYFRPRNLRNFVENLFKELKKT